MKNLLWLLNRLKAMSIREILYRLKKYCIKKINKLRYKKAIQINDLFKYNIDLKKIDKRINKFWLNPELITTNLKNQNLYCVFGEEIDIFKRINWHTGVYSDWEKAKYSLDLDTKFTDNIGDIRYTWEINRHQFFPYLALLYIQTNEERYFSLLESHFYDWIKMNPFLKGINWMSSMEISIRSYQWLIVYYILKDKNKDKFRENIIKSIIFSNKYLSKNLSKYSSANNHLILEAFVMSIVGYSVQDSYKQNWFIDGYNILKYEMIEQNYKDGINKEHALHYQAFVTDAMLQYNFILKKINKQPICETIIKNSLIFIGSMKSNMLNFDYGDSDDAKIISFGLEKKNYYQYLLELGSMYYKEKFIKFNKLSPEVEFISGKNKLGYLSYLEYDKVKLYKDGGYLVVNNEDSVLLMDVAELGFGKIAAHGHADALSLIYYKNNSPIIIDSGTYIYNIDTKNRDYFRSTEAHNTLSYNGLNQSEIKGPFLWGKKAKVIIEDYMIDEDKVIIKASHNGYSPLIHKREVEYSLYKKRLIIRDYFDEKCKINFILDSKSIIEKLNDNEIIIISNGNRFNFKSNFKISIEDTIISKEFMNLEKTKKLVINKNFSNIDCVEIIIE